MNLSLRRRVYVSYGQGVGKIRLEGKQYVVLDGDVVNFRFNV